MKNSIALPSFLTIFMLASPAGYAQYDEPVVSDRLTAQYDQAVYKPQQEDATARSVSISAMAVPVDPIDPGDGSGGGSGGDSGGAEPQWAYENMNARMNIQPGVSEHTTDLLGDRIDSNTGGLGFSNTDIAIPGNFQLPVALKRRFKGIRYAHYNALDVGDWMIDIPHIYTTLVKNQTRYSGEWGQGRECSGSLNPGEIAYYGDTYMNYDYWSGDRLAVPGRVNELLLENSGTYTSQVSHPKVTQSGWRISCAYNPSTGGELFIAQAPNGDKYTFSQLRLIGTEYLDKGTKPIPRYHAFMLATKVEDVHGNSVSYQYDAQGQLSRIEASDGRAIDLAYDSNGRLLTASVGQRDWRYRYSGDSLSEVIRPDGKSWSYDVYEMGLKRPSSQWHCNQTADTDTFQISVTHPDGLKGEFTLGEQRFGRANVVSLSRQGTQLNGICFIGLSLKEKRLSGPGLTSDLVWSYRYSGRKGYFNTASPGSAEQLSGPAPSGVNIAQTRRTKITRPDGAVDYLFYNRNFASVFDNKLIAKQTVASNGTTLLEERIFSYQQGRLVGRTQQMLDNLNDDEYQARLTQKKIDRQLSSNDVYITQYSDFTLLGSPQLEVQSGNAGTRRIERTYRQIPSRWLLDLPAQTSVGGVSDTHRNYSAYGDVISVTRNGVTDEYAYSNGLMTQHTSPRGTVTSYHNYYRGVPRRITTPDGSEYRSVNSYGDITAYTNRIGAQTTYRYDTLGRLTSTTPALGETTSISYGNNQYTVTNGQHRKNYRLDGLNRLLLLTDTDLSNGNKRYQRWRYHKNGQLEFRSVLSGSSSSSYGIRFEYDGLGRLTAQSDPYGTTSWQYLSNHRVRKTDARNYQSISYLEGYTSPADAMRVRIDSPSSSGTVTTVINHDAAGRVQYVSQGGQRIDYRYDNDFSDYVVSEEYPAFTINYTRDAAGNMTQRWINSGSRTNYVYDHNNQLLKINYPDSTADVRFTYREDGLMTSALNGVGNWRYQYNAIGQLTQSQLYYSGVDYSFNYSYNSAQHISALSYPGGYSVSYSPDGRGQATRAGSLVTSLQRHANGSITRLNYGNGLTAYRLLDTPGLRPAALQVKNGSAFKLRKTYSYDAVGNVTAIDDGVQSGYDVRNVQYDGLNRLLSVYSPSFGSIGYAYDKRGNITRLTQAGQAQSYHYTSDDLLSSVSGAVSRTYRYDSAGRVTDNGQINMSYNAADQMVAAGTAHYQYDAHGHRLSKPSGDTTRLTIYSRDGQLLMTRQSAKNTYKVLLDGKSVAQTGHGGTRYFHHDALGSVVGESTASGSLKRQHYRPFGLQVDAYSSPNEQGYTGHVHDDTGLVYMQARYYDPVIGRFYSNDPVGFTGDITTFNRYSYVGNNPYTYTDPTGTTRWKVNLGLKAVGITGGAFSIGASFDDETFEISFSAGASVRAGGEVGTDISFTTEKSSYKGNAASAKATADVSLGLGEETAKYEGEYSTYSGGKHGGGLESALKIDSNGVNLDPNLGVSVGVGGHGEVNISIPDTINNVTHAINSAAKAASEAVDRCMANHGSTC